MSENDKPKELPIAVPSAKDILLDIATRAASDGNHDAAVEAFRMIQAKPGVQTSEFYVALALNAIGFGMHFWPGHEAFGTALMTAGGVAYVLSRGIAKKA